LLASSALLIRRITDVPPGSVAASVWAAPGFAHGTDAACAGVSQLNIRIAANKRKTLPLFRTTRRQTLAILTNI
jgi:hypothetical protein